MSGSITIIGGTFRIKELFLKWFLCNVGLLKGFNQIFWGLWAGLGSVTYHGGMAACWDCHGRLWCLPQVCPFIFIVNVSTIRFVITISPFTTDLLHHFFLFQVLVSCFALVSSSPGPPWSHGSKFCQCCMGLCDPQWLKVDLGKQKLAWDSVFILLNHEIIFPSKDQVSMWQCCKWLDTSKSYWLVMHGENRYLRERKQFGAPLAALQISQEKLVRMLGNIQAMSLLGWRLCKLYEAGTMSPGQASLCKVWDLVLSSWRAQFWD
jgi:hypothetical protein